MSESDLEPLDEEGEEGAPTASLEQINADLNIAFGTVDEPFVEFPDEDDDHPTEREIDDFLDRALEEHDGGEEEGKTAA